MPPIIIGQSRGFKRGEITTREGHVFRARNRPPALQLRRNEQFMEFPIDGDHTNEVKVLLEEMKNQESRSAGSGKAGTARVCKTVRAQEIFNELWEMKHGS